MKICVFATLLFLFTPVVFAADFYEVKLVYTNGTSVKGFAKFPNKPEAKTITFKQQAAGEIESVKSDELFKLVFYGNNDSICFERMATVSRWNKKKTNPPIWMVRVLAGFVSLYSYTDEGYSYFLNNSWHNWPASSHYACIKPGEPAATIISVYSQGTVNNNSLFKAYASEYFSDCNPILKKIADKEFTYKDVVEVVQFYNSWKGEQSKSN